MDNIVTFSKEAVDFLVQTLDNQGKTAVKLNLLLGRDATGHPKMKYDMQTVEGEDVVIDLGAGKKFVIDGNVANAIKGTHIHLKTGLDAEGKEVVGFVFDNPNVPKPVRSGCGGCSGGGCGGGGCGGGGCGSKD